jgi:hypothetical protein
LGWNISHNVSWKQPKINFGVFPIVQAGSPKAKIFLVANFLHLVKIIVGKEKKMSRISHLKKNCQFFFLKLEKTSQLPAI